MEIQRQYRNTSIPISDIRRVIDFIGAGASRELGDPWGQKKRHYQLFYESETATCDGLDEMKEAVAKRGDTLRYVVEYESAQGRLVRIDATDGARITVEVRNRSRTLPLLDKIESLLKLVPLPRRIFLSHGRSSLWTRVQTFIEKEAYLNLEAIEFEQRPKGGRTVAQKLRDEADRCSYAVVVVTGDDLDDEGEPHMRENVMHEIGFFQGRYGFDRVCLLREDDVNIPSNLSGFLYERFPKGDVTAALVGLQRELRAAFPLSA